MTTFFVSDLHLDASMPHTLDSFGRLLTERIGGGDELFILGDLFEVWIGDDDDAPLARSLVGMLRSATVRMKIAFLHGNRDFLVGRGFAAETGVTLLSDPTLIERYGRRLLLSHGDAWCTRDVEYQTVRGLFRSTAWQNGWLEKPLTERREMARELRARSRMANANKAENIMDVTESEVAAAALAQRADLVIHGHTHRPAIHAACSASGIRPNAQRYVLGDWDRCGWLARLDESGLTLERFPLSH